MSTNPQAAGKSYERLRRFSRHEFDARVDATVFRHGSKVECWARTHEIGQDGLGATFSGELQVGEVVSLKFPVPVRPHVLKLRAVVRYREGLRCGLEFLILSKEQKTMLSEVCAVLPKAP